MERRRHIVVNPALDRIQGDIVARSAADAVALMEAVMGARTPNATWDVHEAPPGFPPADAGYVGDDPALLAAARAGRPTRVPNGRALLSVA